MFFPNIDEFLVNKIYKIVHRMKYKNCLCELEDIYPKVFYTNGGCMFEI